MLTVQPAAYHPTGGCSLAISWRFCWL